MKSSKKKVCIIGAGGFGREVLCCLIDQWGPSVGNIEEKVVFMVDDEHLVEKTILGITVIPRSQFNPALYDVIVGIGDPASRKKMIESLPAETTYTTIIHPSAVISKWVEIGEGSIVTAGCILTCDIKIGKHAHFNLHSTVGHDCVIGDYFTSAPGTNISGKCVFGECVYFGTNSSIREGVHLCSNVTIGMGGVVVKNITEEGVYIGNPLKKLEKH